jgi:glycosyltransferase involved in cell wall biosynthesis
MRHYEAHGYRPRRKAVIPNGIDTSCFRFDADSRLRVRHEWGIESDATLVGLVGRADPMKDTSVFLDAARRLSAVGEWRFVCVGDTNTEYGRQLQASDAARELGRSLVWAGTRADMPAVYSAIDTLVLSSRFGEGVPNVLLEAMACEVPCVTTDVGDASAVVGSTGWVVPAGDAHALMEACRAAGTETESLRAARGHAARQRVVDQFSVEQLVDRTSSLLAEIAR